MKREQLVQTAETAKDGGPAALETFKMMAKRAGYAGRRGGWIYRDDVRVCQGWQALAAQVLERHTYRTADVILAAHPEPAPKTEPTRPAPEWWTPKEREVASAAITLAQRMERAAAGHRVIRTGMVPSNHLAPLRVPESGDAGGIGRLLCGRLMGGPTEPVDLDRVDCLGCLDAYVGTLTGNGSGPADPSLAEVRSPVIRP